MPSHRHRTFRIPTLAAALLATGAACAGALGQDLARAEASLMAAAAREDKVEIDRSARDYLEAAAKERNTPELALKHAELAMEARFGGAKIETVLELSMAGLKLGREGGYLESHLSLFFWPTDALRLLHRNAEAFALCEEHLGLAEKSNNPKALVTALAEYGQASWDMDHVELALRAFNRAIPIARGLGEHRQLAFLLLRVARVHERVGDAPAGVPIQREAVEAARNSGNAEVLAEACARLGYSMAVEAKSKEGASLIEEARNAVEEIGPGISAALASIHICKYFRLTKEFARAEEAAREGVRYGRHSGQNDATMACGAVLIDVIEDQGRSAEAIAAGDALLKEVPAQYFNQTATVPFQQRVAFAQLCESQSALLAAAGSHERALDLFRTAAIARSVDLEERHKLDIASQSHRLEAAQNEARIRALDQLRKMQELALEKERLARTHVQGQADAAKREVWSLSVIALLSAGLCGLLLHRSRQARRTQGLLEQQNGRLEQLNQAKDEFLAIAAHDLKSPLGASSARAK